MPRVVAPSQLLRSRVPAVHAWRARARAESTAPDGLGPIYAPPDALRDNGSVLVVGGGYAGVNIYFCFNFFYALFFIVVLINK